MNIPLERICFRQDATAIPNCASPNAWDRGRVNSAKLRRPERWPTSTDTSFVGRKRRMRTIVQATFYGQNHLHGRECWNGRNKFSKRDPRAMREGSVPASLVAQRVRLRHESCSVSTLGGSGLCPLRDGKPFLR